MTDLSRGGRAATASYIEEMTAELGILSKNCGLNVLTYYLEMARHEAAIVKSEARTQDRAVRESSNEREIDADAEELAKRFMNTMRDDR